MAVEVNLMGMVQNTLIMMSNVKSAEQVRKDLLEERCAANVLPFLFIFLKDNANINWSTDNIDYVTYHDGTTFYKQGDEYQTLKFINEWGKATNYSEAN